MNFPRPSGARLASIAWASSIRKPGHGSPHVATPIPQTVAGLALWLDASVSPLPDGTEVPGAPDRSGNGRPCVADTAYAIPTYLNNAIGGLGALSCLGESEFVLTGPGLILAGPCAVLVVLQRPQGGAFTGINPSDPGQAGAGLYLYSDGNTYIQDDSNGSEPYGAVGNPMGPALLRWYRDSAGWTCKISGHPSTGEMLGATGNLTVKSLVHRHASGADASTAIIGEVLIYNGPVTGPDRESIEGYLCTKWGVLP